MSGEARTQTDEKLRLDTAIQKFLNEPECRIIQAVVPRGSQDVVVTTDVQNVDAEAECHILKKGKGPIPEKIQNYVLVLSTLESPLFSLYMALHNIYSPKLLGSANMNLDQKIQQALVDLEKELHTTILRNGVDQKQASELDASAVETIKDEFQYWTEVGKQDGHEADRAEAFAKHLNGGRNQLAQRFESLNELKHDGVMRFLDDSRNTFSNLWNETNFSRGPGFPQTRMKNLFDIVGSGLAKYLRKSFQEVNVWKAPYSKVKQAIKSSTELCENWTTTTTNLTEQDWRERWEGGKYDDQIIAPLRQRFADIVSVRSVYEELRRLLPKADPQNAKLEDAFKIFSNVQTLHCSTYAQKEWEHAIAELNRMLVPIESNAASLIKSRLASLSDHSQSVIGELRSFEHLLSRPNVRNQLEAEREGLMRHLISHVEDIRNQFDTHASTFQAEAKEGEMASPVQCLLWVSRLAQNVNQTSSVVTRVLTKVNGKDQFESVVNSLNDEIKRLNEKSLKDWLSSFETMLGTDNRVKAETLGTWMEVSLVSPKNMKAFYHPRLNLMLQEVRAVVGLGYTTPPVIQKVYESGRRYYHQGHRLKQVANFYNTTAKQIIPSQDGMLFSEMQKVQRIVQDRQEQWDSPQQCEKYTSRLMAAVEEMSTRNRKLLAVHVSLSSHITELMGTDLLKKREEWLEKLKKVQTVFKREDRVTDAKSMQTWKYHWDQQLYKAFEIQYRTCLELLNENLFDIKVELYFSRKRLNFRPPLEDLRTKYYRNLKKFLDLPKTFVGFGETGGLYSNIPERNSDGLLSVYSNAEQLFGQLRELRDSHEHWVSLGTVDIEDYVHEKLDKISDYSLNFDQLEVKRRQSRSIPDSLKIGCFTVSFGPFKSAVEDLMHRFSDAMLLSLRKKTAFGQKQLEEYLSLAMEMLNARPQNVDDMTKAKAQWKELAVKKKEMQRLMGRIYEQNHMLNQKASLPLDISGIKPKWETFVVGMEAFNDMLDDQRENLKGDIEKRIGESLVSVDKFTARWRRAKPEVSGNEMTQSVANKILAEISEWNEELKVLCEQAEGIQRDTDAFDMQAPSFAVLDDVKEEVKSHQSSWSLYADYTTEMEAMTTEAWVAFRARIFAFEDFLLKWAGKLKDGERDIVFDYINKEIRQHRVIWPVLKKLTGELFEAEHWKLLFSKLKLTEVTLPTLTLQHFLDAHEVVLENQKFIDHLAARAQGEVTIRDAVDELKQWAETTEFSLLEHQTVQKKTTVLIKDWKDLFTKLSDQASLVGSLKESPYFPPFADQVKDFEDKIGLLDHCLHDLNQIQRKWVYLEPIFGRGALPQEQARFKRIDSEFRAIMDDLQVNPNVLNLATVPNLKDSVKVMLDQLERCQKALNDFLEQKRSKFPRFYFIGDDDLLEILGQCQNPAVIQNHLKKLFAGIHKVGFSDDNSKIVAMISAKGENVPLLNPVTITEKVENWLYDLSNAMAETLADLTSKNVRAGLDFENYPAQVICLGYQVNFTARVEEAIQSNKLPACLKQVQNELQQITSVETDDRLMQLKLQSLTLDVIHNVDVVEGLIKEQVRSLTEWHWQKQLRFYLRQNGRVVVAMCDAEFDYSYEYQGNASKLVHTPLTDKCYLVLTQGMHLGYGGNPYGPAGTGKTESVKALGQALGRQVLVFNCDEGIDFQSMGRIFTGLVKSGAWGCFDEFNRLKEDQLSAVSQQIQVIQAALKRKECTADLLGKTIEVNFNAAIFVTMNPASKEYGGRSKLPHNLKQLFRAVAMSVPDIALIAEVILFSEGFKFAKQVGHKLTQVYTLSKQLLSPQIHYDWGLRALKTILIHAGRLVRQERKAGTDINFELEAKLVIGALRINTLSKLTYDDSIRFNGLIEDVFPGIKAEDIEYKELEVCIREVLAEMKLEIIEVQIKKILQLNEALSQRMGVVVVGPSGCGKSVMLKVLHKALAKQGQTVVQHFMNPKALDREKLLGHMDQDTREWFDGVLTASARQVMREPQEVHSWVISDGDIDPVWVESLNSVLDDNRLLTMPNGERIQFGTNVNFVFETHDLQFASPATISRMGMIFLSEENADVRALVTAWVGRQPAKAQDGLTKLLDGLFYKALEFVLNSDVVVETTKVGIVTTALTHLRGIRSKGEFVCGLIRGMGANLTISKRVVFAQNVFDWAGERPPERHAPLDCYWSHQGKAYQQYSHEDQKAAKASLSATSPPLVRTVDVQRNEAILKPWLVAAEPVILVGPEGSGKNLLLTNLFKQLKSTAVATVHCSSQTVATHIIQKLNASCNQFTTNKGRCLRPKDGDRLVLFLKDLNLPKPDDYDTIQMIAFLQQLITYQGFHDENRDWISIEGVQIVGSMNPATTVGRSVLSTRYTAINNVLFMTYPDHDQLELVYTCFLKGVLSVYPKISDNKWTTDAPVRKLTSTMVEVYEKIKKTFSPDDHRHYLFNPRDITKWTFGLLRYNLSEHNLLDVWAYEAYRLFCDRLVDRESVRKFESILGRILQSKWEHEVKLSDTYFTTLESAVAQTEEQEEGKDGDAPLEELGSTLEKVGSKDFKALIAQALYNYEREFKDLRMLLFPEILDHIAFEDRVLSCPGGSMLLVGDSGVGRRTSISLVCYMRKIEMWSPKISLNYRMKNFHNDMKEVLRIAGVENKEVLLYLEDYQIVSESMLEDINSLLSAGKIPGLFIPQEMETLLAPIKEEFQADGRFRSVTDFFMDRVRTNLHVVLSMDPNHPQFTMRCESNPAIYTRCTIIWMGKWSKYGMVQVPVMRLKHILKNGLNPDMNPKQLIEQILFIHASMLSSGATPMKYVSFLDTVIKIFDEKEMKLSTQQRHLKGGLTKLSEAADMVDVLSKEAGTKKELVTKKQIEADEALELITESMAVASERRVETEALQKTLAVEEDKLSTRKGQIEHELKDIQPILDKAAAAVGGIKKDNLNEIKAFRMPPPAIRPVLAGVLTLMGESDLSWQKMKSTLGNMKTAIMNFNAETIDKKTSAKVQEIIDKNPNSFNESKIRRVNVAAAPLAVWVEANVQYSRVLLSIAPLRKEFSEATAKLDSARNRLVQCETELKTLDDQVATLKSKFSATTSEAESLKLSLQETTEILDAAQSLLGKLSGEKERWEEQVQGLTSSLAQLPAHALLAGAFVAYLGPRPEDFRRRKLAEWKKKCSVPEFDLLSFMSSESETLKWKAEGLPSDGLSLQNGIIIKNSFQSSLIVDPNEQATEWLKTHLASQSLEVVLQQEQRFVTSLELAVRFGKTLIVQEVDGVEPILYPILRKDFQRQGPRWVVNVGEKIIDYNESFRIFLVTRDPAPDLTTVARALINEVNFTITKSGLEGQLLGITLNHEKPELEQMKSKVLANEDNLKIQLAGLEKNLLQELAESEGNILQNKSLIESLDKTKTQSISISTSLEESKQIQIDLDQQREGYRPIAKVGSVLYFLIAQLAAVNNMYQFSLPTFNQLFSENLDRDTGDLSVKDRIRALCTSLKLAMFRYVTRSLFKSDRVMFALHLVNKLHPKQFEKKEFEFLKGEIVLTDEASGMGYPPWASPELKPKFEALAVTFPDLVKALQFNDTGIWGEWSSSRECETCFPDQLKESISPFQQLLCVVVFRPDRLQSALQRFVCNSLRVQSISPDPLNFEKLTEEASATQPLLFITAAGADPTQELEDFAAKKIGHGRFHQLAMGSGQTEGAIEMLEQAAEDGSWLCLKNLHLVTGWLPVLEKLLASLKPKDTFRLWLTTEPHEKFPNILLQQSLKVTYESPPGVKQNLLRTYENWEPEFISKGSKTRAQTLFCLAWFHAVVQERRTYIPQGFTKFYEFSFADLRSGADIIDAIYQRVNPNGSADVPLDQLPWATILGLFEFAVYGGRLDNNHDVRVLITYLKWYFSKEVLSVKGSSPKIRLSGGIDIPYSNNHSDFLAVINQVPNVDAPVVFSLPANIEGALQQRLSSGVISQLRKLAVSSSLSKKFNRDLWRTQLSPFIQLWDKLKESDGLLAQPAKLSRSAEELQPIDGFVVLEAQKATNLVSLVHSALSAIGNVIFSSGLLSPTVLTDGNAMLQSETPWRWARNWYGPEDPISWLKELAMRRLAMVRWLAKVEDGTLLRSSIALTELFRPRIFLNALRQQTARTTKKPIDSLKLVAAWDPQKLPASAAVKVAVSGLLLQGALLNNGVLAELKEDSPSLVSIPDITFAFIDEADPDPYQRSLAVPVYYQLTREEFICELKIPIASENEANSFILAGVALFLSGTS